MCARVRELSTNEGKKAFTESPLCVLHVDDDSLFLKTTKSVLERHGAFVVESASSVDEALEKMKWLEYDAIISDYEMPGKNGLQFLVELRKKGNKTPFIVYAAKGMEEAAVGALNLGADGYFCKSSGQERAFGELAHGIRMAVERNRAESTREKFAIIGQLAASVAHEVRNPIGVIKNSAFFLKTKLKDNTDEKILKHLRIIEDKVESANSIVSELLDFAGKKMPILQPTDLASVIKGTLANLHIPENIELTTKLDGIPRMMLDPGQIERVFLNIIQNAFEAMPEGGKLMIQASRIDDTVEISFMDSGEGIPESNIPKLFTPLFSTKATGFGLGLIVSKEIVEGHGGSIEVKSLVGEGTTFTLRLPIRHEAEADEGLPLFVKQPVGRGV